MRVQNKAETEGIIKKYMSHLKGSIKRTWELLSMGVGESKGDKFCRIQDHLLNLKQKNKALKWLSIQSNFIHIGSPISIDYLVHCYLMTVVNEL